MGRSAAATVNINGRVTRAPVVSCRGVCANAHAPYSARNIVQNHFTRSRRFCFVGGWLLAGNNLTLPDAVKKMVP